MLRWDLIGQEYTLKEGCAALDLDLDHNLISSLITDMIDANAVDGKQAGEEGFLPTRCKRVTPYVVKHTVSQDKLEALQALERVSITRCLTSELEQHHRSIGPQSMWVLTESALDQIQVCCRLSVPRQVFQYTSGAEPSDEWHVYHVLDYLLANGWTHTAVKDSACRDLVAYARILAHKTFIVRVNPTPPRDPS